MKKKSIIKWSPLWLSLIVIISFVFYSICVIIKNIHQDTEVIVSDISQIPYIGADLKGIKNNGDVRYIRKKTLYITEILFTGSISKDNIEHLCENKQWYAISATQTNNMLGDIYERFDVSKEDYPVSFTENDILLDTPSIQNTKIAINYITSTERFTGYVIINDH